jgi:hypothetical protein
MRFLPKVFAVAAGLLAIGVSSSSVNAKTLMAGTFTLAHPTQWKNTVLPAGNYTFRLAGTQTDTNMLSVRGTNQTLEILVFAQSACETCRTSALNIAVQGDNRAVTSLDLPGFHVDFKGRQSAAKTEKQLAKLHGSSDQVAVHVDSN